MATIDQLLCLKAEAISGTLEALSGSDCIRVGSFIPTVQDFTVVERPMLGARPGEPLPAVMTQRKSTFEVPFEVAGSGTRGTPSGIDKPLLMSGFNKATVAGTSITYSLAWPQPVTTYSAAYFLDGQRYAAAGCRGSKLSISAKAGGVLEGMLQIVGLYRAPTTEANPSPIFPTQRDPVAFNSQGVAAGTLTLTTAAGTVALCVAEYEVTVENTTTLSDRAGCVPRFDFTGRKVTGSITFERPALATLDAFTIAANSTLGALVVPVGTVVGNITTFNHPVIQLGPIELVDLDGIPGCKASFTQRADAANQEFFIVQT